MPTQPLPTRVQPPQILQNPAQLFRSIAISQLPYVLTGASPTTLFSGNPSVFNGWNDAYLKAAFKIDQIPPSDPSYATRYAEYQYIEQNFKPLDSTQPVGGIAFVAVREINSGNIITSASGNCGDTVQNWPSLLIVP